MLLDVYADLKHLVFMGPQLLSVQKHLLYEEGHIANDIYPCHLLILLSKKMFIQ